MTSSTTSKTPRGRTNTGYKYVTRLSPGGRSAHRAERIMAHADQAGTGSARTFNIDAYGVEGATRLAVEHVGVEPFLGLRAAGLAPVAAPPGFLANDPDLHPYEQRILAGETVQERTKSLRKIKQRVSSFRRRVLEAWGTACTVCGYDEVDANGNPLVDAAHLKPVAEGGTDSYKNGRPLCPTHHREYDRGLLTREQVTSTTPVQPRRPGSSSATAPGTLRLVEASA